MAEVKKTVLTKRELKKLVNDTLDGPAGIDQKVGGTLRGLSSNNGRLAGDARKVLRRTRSDLNALIGKLPAEGISSQEERRAFCESVGVIIAKHKEGINALFKRGGRGGKRIALNSSQATILKTAANELRANVASKIDHGYEFPKSTEPEEGKGVFGEFAIEDKREWSVLQISQFFSARLYRPYVEELVEGGYLPDDEVLSASNFRAMAVVIGFLDWAFRTIMGRIDEALQVEEEGGEKVSFDVVKEIMTAVINERNAEILERLSGIDVSDGLREVLASEASRLVAAVDELIETGEGAGKQGFMELNYNGRIEPGMLPEEVLIPTKGIKIARNREILNTEKRGKEKAALFNVFEEDADYASLPHDEARALMSLARRGRREGNRPSFRKIAHELNDHFHAGLAFRTPVEVKHLISQMDKAVLEQRVNEEREKLERREHIGRLLDNEMVHFVERVVSRAASLYSERTLSQDLDSSKLAPVARDEADEVIAFVAAFIANLESNLANAMEPLWDNEEAFRAYFQSATNQTELFRGALNSAIEDLEMDFEAEEFDADCSLVGGAILESLDAEMSDDELGEFRKLADLDVDAVVRFSFVGMRNGLRDIEVTDLEVQELTAYCRLYIGAVDFDAAMTVSEEKYAEWAVLLNDSIFAGYPLRDADFVKPVFERILRAELERELEEGEKETLSPELIERRDTVLNWLDQLRNFYCSHRYLGNKPGKKGPWQWRMVQAIEKLLEDALLVGSLVDVETQISRLEYVKEKTTFRYDGEGNDLEIARVDIKIYEVEDYMQVLASAESTAGVAKHRATDRLAYRLRELDTAISEAKAQLDDKKSKSVRLDTLGDSLEIKEGVLDRLRGERDDARAAAEKAVQDYFARIQELQREGAMMTMDENKAFIDAKEEKEALVKVKEREIEAVAAEIERLAAQIEVLSQEIKAFVVVETVIESVREKKARLLAAVEAAVADSVREPVMKVPMSLDGLRSSVDRVDLPMTGTNNN